MAGEDRQIRVTIDGRTAEVSEGLTILDAARSLGITIPTLCHHPDLSDVGACRMCVVSVDKAAGVQTACTTPVADGMVVDTMSASAVATRRFTLEMLLSDHPNECMTCEVNGDCELQDLAYDYDVPWSEVEVTRHHYEPDPDPNPFIYIDLEKCILCSRCIRACSEIQNRDVWSFAQRGFHSKLVAGADQPLLDARCESCGQCVAYCPVGALYDKMSVGQGRPNQVEKVTTICSFCGVGCQFDLNVRDGKVVRVTSDPAAPVNGMSLCVKGRYGFDYIHHPDRLERPLVRARWLDGVHDDPDAFVETDWDTALDVVVGRFAEEKKRAGGEGFAMLASAKCTSEENYLFSKFTRQLLGTHTIDHCARL